MKKTLLFTIISLLTLSVYADDISGKYTGNLGVSIDPNTTIVADIFVEKEEGGTYALSVKDFDFQGMLTIDLVVTGIQRTDEGGTIILSKEGASAGPDIFPGMSLLIYLNSATINDGVLELELNVKTATEDEITDVTFTGTREITITPITSDISGKYTGNLEVSIDPNATTVADVYVEKEEGGTYALSVKDFDFQGMLTIDLVVTGIQGTEEDGTITLWKDGASEGPSIPGMNLLLYLNSATINDGVLELELSVKMVGPDNTEIDVTDVTFTGTREITSISNTVENTLSIYFSNNVIALEGYDNENYVIYSQTGAVVQMGKVQNGKIDTNFSSTGTYILSVSNQTTKFIK